MSFPKVILNHPVLLSPRGRNRLRAWTFSRAFDVENQTDIRSYVGELFKRASIRFGADPNLDWKEGLKNALGENYNDWIMHLADYESYNKNDPLDFLECHAKIVENVMPRLGLTAEEVDRVLTQAYPLFLCFLWETMNVVEEVKFKGFYGYLGSVFKWKSKRFGTDLRNLDWKNGLKKALGEKYNDWIVHVEQYDRYLKDDPLSFLVCSQKIVTQIKNKLRLTEDEVDSVLSKAYPDFLVVLFETMFLTTEMPGESLAKEWERWDGYR